MSQAHDFYFFHRREELPVAAVGSRYNTFKYLFNMTRIAYRFKYLSRKYHLQIFED